MSRQSPERERHRLRVVEDLGRARVREELTAAREAEAQEQRRVRSEEEADDRGDEHDDPSAARAPPPQTSERNPMSAMSAMTPAKMSAIVIRYVSRLRMCATSCASTASSSRWGIVASSPS